MSHFFRYTVDVEEMARGWAVKVSDPELPVVLTGPNLERLLRMAAGWMADASQVPRVDG